MRGEHGLEKFKSNLKELRQAAGLTLDELADETGIGKRTIITIENEAGADPSVGAVKRLLKYLRSSTLTIMKGRASAVRKCKKIVRDVALALVVYSNYNKKCIEHWFV